MSEGEDMDASDQPESQQRSSTHDGAASLFKATATLSQTIVSIHTMHNLHQAMPYIGGVGDQLPSFYAHMSLLSHSWSILPCHRRQHNRTNQPRLLVLWHYGCLLFLANMNEVGKLATSNSHQDRESINELKGWLGTMQARLATLHCACILIHSAEIMDLTLLVPR
jgi:hypothetical protein